MSQDEPPLWRSAAAFGEQISRLRKLTTLTNEGGGFGDEWMPQFARSKNLTELSRQGTGVTDITLAHFKDLQLEACISIGQGPPPPRCPC